MFTEWDSSCFMGHGVLSEFLRIRLGGSWVQRLIHSERDQEGCPHGRDGYGVVIEKFNPRNRDIVVLERWTYLEAETPLAAEPSNKP